VNKNETNIFLIITSLFFEEVIEEQSKFTKGHFKNFETLHKKLFCSLPLSSILKTTTKKTSKQSSTQMM